MAIQYMKKPTVEKKIVDFFPSTALQDVDSVENYIDEWFDKKMQNHQYIEDFPKIVDPNSKWRVSSCLQKAIRRGDLEYAIKMASALVIFDPAYFLTRINVIALEDVGLANPLLTASILYMSGKQKTLQGQYGLASVAQMWVTEMTTGIKDRSLTELMYICEYGPLHEKARQEYSAIDYKKMLFAQEIHQLLEGKSTGDKAVLLRYMAGTTKFKSETLLGKEGCYDLLMDYCWETLPPLVAYIAYKGSKKSVYNLWQPIPILHNMIQASTVLIKTTEIAESPKLRGVKAYAYDMFTQEGKRSYAYFAKICDPVREFIATHGIKFNQFDASAFLSESGLLDKSLHFAGKDDLEMEDIKAGYMTANLEHNVGHKLTNLFFQNIDLLNKSRIRIVEGK